MAELRTEEEQVQAIKDWWKKNGSSLLIGIAAALAIVFGWQAWQNHQTQQRTEAANQFGALLDAFAAQSGQGDAETVSYVAEQLRTDYEDSAYAVYGMLILARQQLLDQGDAAAAIDSLKWAQGKVEDGSALALVVRNRLARAQFASEQYDEALQTLEGAGNAGAYAAIYAELRGDILLARGDREAAREAYLAAREESGSARNGVLELKLSDLGVGEGA